MNAPGTTNAKTTEHIWLQRLATAATVIAVPLAVMTHGPVSAAADAVETCAPPAPLGGQMMLPPPLMMPDVQQRGMMPPPGSFPAAPLPGAMPMPPYLHAIELTEAQRDKLFALMDDRAPNERDQLQKALRAMEDLRRLVAADRFDVDKARILAETHGQALAQLALMHAELDARMRAILTPEQRKQLDDARTNAESRRGFKCS